MALYDQPTLMGGMDDTLVEVASTVSTFIPGLLIFVFGFIWISGMATQKRATGYADVQMWTVMASVGTMLVSLMLTLRDGLMNIEILGVVMAINVFSGLWLFLSRGRGEL